MHFCQIFWQNCTMLFIVILNLFLSYVYSKDGFDNNCLESHNQFRKKHGSPPMTWSESLAADAQKWADELAREDKFDHDTKTINSKNQGENLAYFSPPRKKCMGAKSSDCVQCSEMVTDWYNEVKDYDFNTGKAKVKGKAVLHFTQVVWKDSVELGVGTSNTSKTYGFITVARYSPRGNMGPREDYKKNVFPEGAAPPAGSTNGSTTPETTPTKGPSQGGAVTTPLGTTSPETVSTPSGTASPAGAVATSSGTTPPPTPAKTAAGGSKCEYFMITKITEARKIIEKCKGKPDVTFIEVASPKLLSTNPPTTIPTGGSTGQPTASPSGGTTGQPTMTPTTKVDKDQHDKSIMLINLYRVMHGAGPLVWSKQLEEQAQSWAENLAKRGSLDHDVTMKDGENIAKLPASNKGVMNAVDAWYDEGKGFDYNNPRFSKATGHFSQIVWKGSKEMGLGIAPSKDNSEYYIVARFRPSGNIEGKFAENVGPKVLT